MATPKGNFVAYTPLKPTEMKVGELYGKWVDNYIKRGDAERAAKAKLLAEEKKAMGERFDKMKIDPFATISNLQDMGGDMFRNTADYVGRMRMMAEKDFENRHIYLNRAEKAMNDYREIATAFGNKDFIDKANAKAQAIANHDVFLDTDDNDQLRAISAGMVSYNLDETTGEIYFNLPKNRYSTDEDKAVRLSVGEVLHKYSTPDEINMLNSNQSNGQKGFLDKIIPDVAKEMQDKWSKNNDGNREISWAGFAKDRATVWFDTTFGGYDANNIDPRLRQYSKRILKKNIESEEDYNLVKNSVIDRIGAYVPEENKKDTKYTPAQMVGQQLNNEETRLNINKKKAEAARGYPSSSGSGGGSNNKVAISNVDGGILQRTGGVNRHWEGGTLINLDNKEFIYGFKAPNKDGKTYSTRYAILGKDNMGRLGFETYATRGDVAIRLRGYNYDPKMVESIIMNSRTAGFKTVKDGLTGTLKYDGAYKESGKSSGSSNPLEDLRKKYSNYQINTQNGHNKHIQ